MKITNLEDLRKHASEKDIKKIITEYMMETIACNTIMNKLDKYIRNTRNDTTITIGELKNKIIEFSETEDIFEE
jgi:hypothetical protein